jgi:hypothetical protein
MAVLAFLQSTSDTSDASTYTFASQNLGAASIDRLIIVTAAFRGGSGTRFINGSIAGITAATIFVSESLQQQVAMFAAVVPTGTTGDIVVNLLGGNSLRCRISVWAAIKSSRFPHRVATSAADDPTTNIDVPANGFAIATAVTLNASATTTWTGLTEVDDTNVESAITVSSASSEFVSEQTGLAVTANFSAGTPSSAVFVSWGPSSSSGSPSSYAFFG